MPTSNIPIRICGSKVRTGCITCKKRHLKCDEGRPYCQKCIKIGSSCSYRRAPDARPKQPTTALASFLPPTLLKYKLHPCGPMEVDDLHAFGHFLECTAVELGGPFSSLLWRQALPQFAYSEPSIRHGVIAVSLLHTNFKTGTLNLKSANKHYSEAVRHVLSIDKSTPFSRDTALLSCVLFATAEALQGHFRSALVHVNNGMKLLLDPELSEARKEICHLPTAALQTIFAGLDTQAVELSDAGFRFNFSETPAADLISLAQRFDSLHDAHIALSILRHRLSRLFQWSQPADGMGEGPDLCQLMSERENLITYFKEWSLVVQNSSLNKVEPGYLVLVVHKMTIKIMFDRTYLGTAETHWDTSIPEFKQIVDYADAIMKVTSRTTSSNVTPAQNDCKSGTSPTSAIWTQQDRFSSLESEDSPTKTRNATMTLATDIIMPVFMACVRCRDPVTRRRALRVLQTYNRREGLWDSNLAAHVAEKVIEIEETKASAKLCSSVTQPTPHDYIRFVQITNAKQIPEECRVNKIDVTFGIGKTAQVKYKTSRIYAESFDYNGNSSDDFEETINW